jgi:hypothetical protein
MPLKRIDPMKSPGFLVLDGYCDEIIPESFLFVRPMGTDALFTVSAIVASNKEIKEITGKVILVDYISDGYMSVKPAKVAQKSFRHCSPFDGKGLRASESIIALTGQFLEKVVEGDGHISYIIDTIFPMTGHFDFYDKEPGKKGDWLEFEMQMEVMFNKVLSVEEWTRLNPDRT